MNLCRTSLPLLSLFLVLNPLTASPQSPEHQPPEPRLHGAIRGDAPAVLPGSISPRIRHAQDLGPAAASQPLHGITLVFRRSEAQQADLDHLLSAQQDPTSPDFHRWLTPEAFGARFGMADADLDTTQRWLAAQGFTISSIAHARDRITFSGTAAQVAAAFHTTLHHYQVDGELHLAPNSDLALPADLAAVTTAILHLSDFRPRPSVHPAFTAAADQAHYLTPADLKVMYDLPAGTASNTSGTGQSIAIVGQSYVNISGSSLLPQFFDTNLLSVFGVLVPDSGVEAVSPGDAAETEIDLEYAGGIAPMASIFLVHVGSDPSYSVFDALAFAIDQNVAPVVNISYGECESLLSATDLQQGNALFQQAATQGQTLVAAAGDAGSTACAPVSSRYVTLTQQEALAVDYPAASPYVTAVGGTQMAAGSFTSGDTIYWAPATVGFDLESSLISYVPELAWNEDSTFSIFAGGGGASSVYGRPTWQAGVPGIPAGSTRLLPDIALQASSQNPGFLLCTDDASFLASEGQQYGCQYGLRADNGQYTIGGGTSFAAPVLSAIIALINQSQHELGQGPLGPTLYRLAANPAISSVVFHDVTSGSIACTAGSPKCTAIGRSGFAAAPGYDQATGLGSIDFAHLLAAWPTTHATSLSATVTEVFPFNYSAAPGATDYLNIMVFPNPISNGTPPTGAVSVSVDGTLVDPAVPFSSVNSETANSTGSYPFVAPTTPGSHIATVTYPGDATHGPSSGTVSILVGNALAFGGLSLTAGNVTVPANGSANTPVTITPSGGYNGRVFWSIALTGGTGSGTICYSIPTVAIQGVTSTTLSLFSGTACSSSSPSTRSGSGRLIQITRPIATNSLQPSPWTAVPIAAGLALCGLLPSLRRRRPLPLLALLLVAIAGTTLSGCGGGGSGSTSASATATPAVPAVTYNLTLTGQDSVTAAITSSTAFTLTVE